MFLQKASQHCDSSTSTFRSSRIDFFYCWEYASILYSFFLTSVWPVPLVCENTEVLNLVLLSSAAGHGSAGLACLS